MDERQNRVTKGEWGVASISRLYLKDLSVTNVATCDGTAVDINFWKWDRQSGRSQDIEWHYQGESGK